MAARKKQVGRATPVQRRSEETFARILDAGMQLLEETGLAGFNTNAVAQAAGINIGTLYHYFADKNALLTAMFARSERERTDVLTARLASLDGVDNLGEWVHETVAVLLKMRAKTPGATVLRNAVRVVPELYELGHEQDERSALALAAALRVRYPNVTKARAEAVARMVIDAGVAALDRVGAGNGNARTVQHELTEMITAYISTLG